MPVTKGFHQPYHVHTHIWPKHTRLSALRGVYNENDIPNEPSKSLSTPFLDEHLKSSTVTNVILPVRSALTPL